MYDLPDAVELLWLFEAEPDPPRYPDYPNIEVAYSTKRGEDLVRCGFRPLDGEIRLQCSRDGLDLVDLRLLWVDSVRIAKFKGAETLVISFSKECLTPLWLQLKPSIRLTWKMSRYPLRNPGA